MVTGYTNYGNRLHAGKKMKNAKTMTEFCNVHTINHKNNIHTCRHNSSNIFISYKNNT